MKLKLKKTSKQRTVNNKYHNLRSNKQWTQTFVKSKHFSLQRKKQLVKHHNLCNIKEYNSTLIYNLESAISTTTFKDRHSTVKTSNVSSSSTSVSELVSSINYLKCENDKIEIRISEIRTSSNLEHTNITKYLKKIGNYHGTILRKRLNHINANHRLFLNFIKQRSNLLQLNISQILDKGREAERLHLIDTEKTKLASSHKVHNFTNSSPPPDLIAMLNKGTNLIPTSSSVTTSTIHQQIHSEVDDAFCSIIKKGHNPLKSKTTKTSERHQPYSSRLALKVLKENQTKPNFNIHIIDYINNTTTYTKHFLTNFTPCALFEHNQLNITNDQLTNIQQFYRNPDIILTKTDKNMGWGLAPISWFTTEYTRHLSDNSTYKLIDNFDFTSTVLTSNRLLKKLKLRFDKLLNSTNDKQLLQPVDKNALQVPYMKLLPKVHKLDAPASTDNLNKLTGRPIITAHSWITSNPSRLLGTELDSIILQIRPFSFQTKHTFSVNLQLYRLT